MRLVSGFQSVLVAVAAVAAVPPSTSVEDRLNVATVPAQGVVVGFSAIRMAPHFVEEPSVADPFPVVPAVAFAPPATPTVPLTVT
jgi:hypothetical protein